MQPPLSYALHHLSFLLDRHSDIALKEVLGIGFSQYKILRTAKQRSGMRQNEIASSLGQTEASVSRQLGILRQKGLVVPVASGRSGASKPVIISEEGLRALDEAEQVLYRAHAAVLGSLSFAEQKLMQELIERLISKASTKK